MALSKENKWGFPSGADKPLVLLAKEGPLYILTLQNVTADNWFTSAFMKAVTEALDKVLQDLPEKEPAALITTGHNPKIYSNGLALEEAFQNGQAYFAEYMTLVQKMLVFPIPTVAALNGHAFAGGCMFSLAHDYRVMRGDRGFICLNEVDIPAALTPGMMALIRSKVPNSTLFRNMILQGHRVDAKEALATGLVDAVAPSLEELPMVASALALKWANKAAAGAIYGYLKEEMFIVASQKLKSGALSLVSLSTGIPDVSPSIRSKL